jgi:DNA-binding winged helix-turn-helix (wHTH) protein
MKHFPPFVLDSEDASLLRDDVRIPLSPKAFAVLQHLVNRAGKLVTKADLLKAVWPQIFVHEGVLKVCILEIRKALGDDVRHPRFIETLHKRGYRFVAPVSEDPGGLSDARLPHLIGRDAEVALLSEVRDRAFAGARQLVFIAGEPGIGKTTLLQHFLRGSESRGASRIARAQCVEHCGEPEPYYPVFDALARAANEWGAEPVTKVLRTCAPTWLIELPSLTSPDDMGQLKANVLGATRPRMLREIGDAIEAFTRDVPLTFTFEDLQWSDPSTLDLISWLMTRPDATRLLIIATYRSMQTASPGHPFGQWTKELRSRGLCHEIHPRRLNVSDISTYLDARYPGHGFPPVLGQTLHHHTSGNPLFMVSLLDYFESKSILGSDGGQWRLSTSLENANIGLPDSLVHIIRRQIAAVDPEERQVLEAASVAGVEFTVSQICDPDNACVVESMCNRLASRQLLITRRPAQEQPDGTATASYAFLHSLYREVLYDDLLVTSRARLHSEVGGRMERVTAIATSETAFDLAMHFEQAGKHARAIHYLQIAAHRASSRHAQAEAVAMLERAERFCSRIASAERLKSLMAILEQNGITHRIMGNLFKSAEIFRRMSSEASLHGDRRSELRAQLWLASVLSWVDRAGCLHSVDHAIEISRFVDDPLMIASLQGQVAYWNLLFRGWTEADKQASSASIEEIRKRGDLALLSLHSGRYAFFLCLDSHYDEAARAAEESIRAAIELNEVTDYSVARFFQAWALISAGEWGRFRSVSGEAIAVAAKNGHELWSVLFRLLDAWLYVQMGAFEPAYEISTECASRAVQLNHPLSQQISSVLLGYSAVGLGLHEEGAQVLQALRERQCRERILMDWIWRVPLQFAFVELQLMRKDLGQAQAEAELAIEAAYATAEKSWQAMARWFSARVSILGGDSQSARQEIERGLDAIEGFPAPLARWRLYLTRHHLTGDESSRSAAANLVQQLADTLPGDDPARSWFLTYTHSAAAGM